MGRLDLFWPNLVKQNVLEIVFVDNLNRIFFFLNEIMV